jgi:hypothetical protein
MYLFTALRGEIPVPTMIISPGECATHPHMTGRVPHPSGNVIPEYSAWPNRPLRYRRIGCREPPGASRQRSSRACLRSRACGLARDFDVLGSCQRAAGAA